ncbi:hypothetical protein DERP_014433 [Dermatophagoides pteronyssinus]|uniref:DUF3795 domain-containing protein n=1 Tax=Dermatophagoides pteronyssinus TaxID=6956 RepID=A0ABQ8IVR1_DERPT|nr:hypothetical protein DERP_014433 [Dermatophagoides pteronyssinus]
MDNRCDQNNRMILMMINNFECQGLCCHRVRIYNCSGNDNELQTLCPDCTEPTPWCGITKCNVFGCNCDECRMQKPYTRIDNLAIPEIDDNNNHF